MHRQLRGDVALTSRTAPGVTRRFVRLPDYVAEVIDARVYDGVHYRIGEYTIQTHLRPIR